jgi:flagellar basal body-associated protein FliL
MSDEAEKPADAAAAPKKSKMGLIIGVIIALVTLVGGSVAGAVLGPKLLGGSSDDREEGSSEGGHGKGAKGEKGEKSHKSEKSEKKGSHGDDDEDEAPEQIVTSDIPAIVVDLRDTEGRIRHLKVGLTAELGDKVTAEEFKLVIPRGREAALTYLRSLTFEDVADSQRFMAIKDELSKRVTEAVGEERVHRMMLTDFVLQ